MLGRFYEQVVDVTLYCQMADLIFRLSEHPNKERLYNRLQYEALFLEVPEQEMEQEYGLRYPGEVLERLDEKMEVTERQLRALGLALVMTKELQSSGMFIGKQQPSFWKRMKRTLKKSDLYWLGIQYLMEDGGQRELHGKLLEFPVKSVEELLFILSILPDDQAVWDTLKKKLDHFFGKGRNFSVYTHAELYVWMTTHYHRRMEGYRRKDIDTLKYLMRLPFSYAKEGSRARKKLMEAGYSVKEILFLSMTLLYEVQAQGLLKQQGLTAERMAVETCLVFLKGNSEDLEVAGELCERLLKDYRRFEVRLEDTSGISDRLYELLKVENVRTYQLLLSSDTDAESHPDWFLIDLTDPKWHALYSLIGHDSFKQWVLRTLSLKEYTRDEMKQCLFVYQELTGETVFSYFWQQERCELRRIFGIFAELELIQPSVLLEECLTECQSDKEKAYKKWEHMAAYLRGFVKGLKSPEAVEMLFLLESFCQMTDHRLFQVEELLLDSVGIRESWGYGRKQMYFSNMDLIRPFLGDEEHRKLFCILEEKILRKYPDKYLSFLIKILSAEDNFLWFPKEEAREIFQKLYRMGKIRAEEGYLLKMYLTEEEQEAAAAEKKKKEERQLMAKEIRQVRDVRKDFSTLVAKIKNTEEHFLKLKQYLDGYCSERVKRREKKYIVKRYLCSVFEKEQQVFLSRNETENLCELVISLFTWKELSLAEMREILGHIEITEGKEEAA